MRPCKQCGYAAICLSAGFQAAMSYACSSRLESYHKGGHSMYTDTMIEKAIANVFTSLPEGCPEDRPWGYGK